jgi:hypothetical protein
MGARGVVHGPSEGDSATVVLASQVLQLLAFSVGLGPQMWRSGPSHIPSNDTQDVSMAHSQSRLPLTGASEPVTMLSGSKEGDPHEHVRIGPP